MYHIISYNTSDVLCKPEQILFCDELEFLRLAPVKLINVIAT